jgi:LuxR family maltose regulon positive regulatory protein
VKDNSAGLALEDRLLATKLYAPSARTTLVTRPRLTERLEEGTKGKLTLVCAPAGFGKTTLLSEWILQSELSVGWLSLDEGDNDPTRFLSYVITAIQSVKADVGKETLSSLRSAQPPPTQIVLTALVNELATVPHDLALILDDYHVLDDEPVHAAVAFLLEHLPPQMHLIIASRTDPPLSLSRLLASGNLTRLSDSDLQFTPPEAVTFLNEAMGLELSAEDVAALEERTEGWIAGLQLAALSLRGREDVSGFVSAFAGTSRQVFDYLAEEVFEQQPEDTRTFLLETSILDRLNGSLCDAVRGRDGGQTTLENLEGAHLLLVPLDDQRHWYRYHHLFSDFLRERIRRENVKMVPELHRRASVWHERNGTAGEAVSHALAAEDYERAGGLIERLADSMVGRGEIPTVARLLEALPEEVLRSRPGLLMRYAAIVLTPNGRWDAAEAALRDVERILGSGGGGFNGYSPESFTKVIEDKQVSRDAGYVVTARGTIAMECGELEDSIALNRRALELLASEEQISARGIAAVNLSECLVDLGDFTVARRAIDEAIEIGRETGFQGIATTSLCQLGRLQTVQGRLSEAIRTYERVLRLASEHAGADYLLVNGFAHVRMGEVLLERNDLQAATHHLLSGVELLLEYSGLWKATSEVLEDPVAYERLRSAGEVYLEDLDIDSESAPGVVTGYIALARVRQVQGDAESSLEALRKADNVAQGEYVTPRWRRRAKKLVETWRARLRMMQGDLDAAVRWAREQRLSAEDSFEYSPESELEYLTLARLLIVEGKPEEASRLLERLLEAAETGERGRTIIEVLVLKALVLRTQSDEPGALAALRKALTLAEPEDFVRSFADEGAPMLDLLRRVLKALRRDPPDSAGDVPLEYTGKLLEALGAPLTAPTKVHVRDPAELVLEPITERELEVLKLLDSNLSNREIAASLFVSLATVKTHTKHLYRKLGVHARHEAIVRGKELGLL